MKRSPQDRISRRRAFMDAVRANAALANVLTSYTQAKYSLTFTTADDHAVHALEIMAHRLAAGHTTAPEKVNGLYHFSVRF